MLGLMRGRSGDGKARPLSYANVVSTMALVLAVGGGSALAAGSLASQAKAKVTLNKADKAYISAQIAAGHVAFAASAAQATNATTANSAKIATNIFSATVGSDGSLVASIPAGATSSRHALGDYHVSFGRSITGCMIGVSLSSTTVQLGMVGVGVIDANTLQVFTRSETNTVEIVASRSRRSARLASCIAYPRQRAHRCRG